MRNISKHISLLIFLFSLLLLSFSFSIILVDSHFKSFDGKDDIVEKETLDVHRVTDLLLTHFDYWDEDEFKGVPLQQSLIHAPVTTSTGELKIYPWEEMTVMVRMEAVMMMDGGGGDSEDRGGGDDDKDDCHGDCEDGGRDDDGRGDEG